MQATIAEIASEVRCSPLKSEILISSIYVGFARSNKIEGTIKYSFDNIDIKLAKLLSVNSFILCCLYK